MKLTYGSIEVHQDGDRFVANAETAGHVVAFHTDAFVELCRDGAITADYDDILIAGTLRYRIVGVDEGRLLVLQRLDAPPESTPGGS